MHTTTEWQIEPSFKYEVLCFIGILTDDPFYLKYYQAEYNKFEPLLTEEVRQALAHVKAVIKGAGSIVSATLCWIFSAVEDSTLDELLNRLDNMETVWNVIRQKHPDSLDTNQKLITQVQDNLKIIFAFLQAVDFYFYWKTQIEPVVASRIREVEPRLADYNIIPTIEAALGKAFESNRVIVHLLYYIKPHGMSMIGTRFLTGSDYSFEIVIRNAIHELMHPPYTLDSELRAATESLREDAFFMGKVQNHNPDFGYNSFEGLLEEDVVQALDQIISEKFNIGHQNPVERWQKADDGIHVLAAVLYTRMKHFLENGENIREFLIRVLPAIEVKSEYEAFISSMP